MTTLRIKRVQDRFATRYSSGVLVAALLTMEAFDFNLPKEAPLSLLSTITTASTGDLAFDINVDYGAQLLLIDSSSRKTGYDEETGDNLTQIPGASYADDSISDATDDSPEPAVAESRVLAIHPMLAETYTLEVFPTDRDSYNIQFSCVDIDGQDSASISAQLRISKGETNRFWIKRPARCSMPFVYGALGGRGAATSPLLTFAHPLTNNVTQHGSLSFHMTVVYDAKIVPSSFVATVNGRNVHGLFHPKQSTMETVTIPLTPGSNVIRLTVGATSPSHVEGNTTTHSFTVHVE